MQEIDASPLTHSWPLYDAQARFRAASFVAEGAMALPAIGRWSCDLADNRLRWSPEVFALFGLSVDEPVTRALALDCYSGRSRIAMEALRAHAIRHRRGFSMDAFLRRPDGEERWMRLSAMPVLSAGKVVRLTGTKRDVTALYDSPAPPIG